MTAHHSPACTITTQQAAPSALVHFPVSTEVRRVTSRQRHQYGLPLQLDFQVSTRGSVINKNNDKSNNNNNNNNINNNSNNNNSSKNNNNDKVAFQLMMS